MSERLGAPAYGADKSAQTEVAEQQVSEPRTKENQGLAAGIAKKKSFQYFII